MKERPELLVSSLADIDGYFRVTESCRIMADCEVDRI